MVTEGMRDYPDPLGRGYLPFFSPTWCLGSALGFNLVGPTVWTCPIQVCTGAATGPCPVPLWASSKTEPRLSALYSSLISAISSAVAYRLLRVLCNQRRTLEYAMRSCSSSGIHQFTDILISHPAWPVALKRYRRSHNATEPGYPMNVILVHTSTGTYEVKGCEVP